MSEQWEIRWEDYYKILQVDSEAEPEVVQAAYRKLALKYHPDVGKNLQSEERMKQMNRAYEMLKDPEKRRRYHSAWLENTKRATEETKAYTSRAPRTEPEVTPRPTYSTPPKRERPADQRETQRRTYGSPPSDSTRQGKPVWAWLLLLILLGIVIGLNGQFGTPNTLTETDSLSLNKKMMQSAEKWYKESTGYNLYPNNCFVIEKNIWVVRREDLSSEPPCVIYSSDNGNTWERNPNYIFTVYFFNDTEGLAANYTRIFKTSDGGKTWNTLLSIPEWYGYGESTYKWSGWGAAINSFTFTDKQHMLVRATKYKNIKIDTSDGGKSWEYVILNLRYKGSETVLRRTRDGGKTWEEVDIARK